MFKKTAITTLVGLMAATAAMSANAFTILAGDYKMTVDGYVNGTLYAPASTCGGTTASASNISSCDSAVALPAVGSSGSEDSWGILSISSITNTTTNTDFFNRGANGYIIGYVAGLTDFFSTPLGTQQSDYATGGMINLYLSTSNYDPKLSTNPSTNQANVFASVTNLPLYLSLAFVVGATDGSDNPAGLNATYHSDFNSSNSHGSGSGFLEVTGGTAATAFHDPNCTNMDYSLNCYDASFSTTLSPLSTNNQGQGNWLAVSTSDVVGTAIPEPGSMALAGLGLMGLAALRRRKSQG